MIDYVTIVIYLLVLLLVSLSLYIVILDGMPELTESRKSLDFIFNDRFANLDLLRFQRSKAAASNIREEAGRFNGDLYQKPH